MEYIRKNKGTCARATKVVIEDGIVQDAVVVGGCDGNIKGIISLLKGMPAQEAAQRMKGITCGRKSTSCPDQLALALEEAISGKTESIA